MIKQLFSRQKSVILTTLIGLIFIAVLIALPTGYEDALIYKGTERAVGTVGATDNSAMIPSGLIQSGEQMCTIEIEHGKFKGQTLTGVNFLSGSLEKDKIFKDGDRALFTGILITVILTVMIIFFVYGADIRTVTASAGSLLGVAVTCVLGILFTDLFRIHGAVMPNAESLLYSGYQDLDLTSIFMSSIFIGASGAMMDLAVDITSAVWEVIEKKPDISAKEAMLSGIRVGRAAMGTMTTTLLLAYSGGYIALLMVFMAQGTPVDHILNYKYVASEILDTVVGSFGLVTVAPFTAAAAGLLLTRGKAKQE